MRPLTEFMEGKNCGLTVVARERRRPATSCMRMRAVFAYFVRNPGDGWRMRMQVIPGLVVRRPGSRLTLCILLQERHLQDVIHAKQTNSVKKKHVYIPTPEATIPVEQYSTVNQQVNRGHQYVRVPGK